MTAKLLQQWGFDGYIRWLRGIKATYRMRKTWMCDTFDDFFHLEFDFGSNGVSTNSLVLPVLGGRGVTCYSKLSGDKWDEKRGLTRGPALLSFIPPTAGMFIFLAVHFDQHPDYDALTRKGEDATRVLTMKLWQTLADDLVSRRCRWLLTAGIVRTRLCIRRKRTPRYRRQGCWLLPSVFLHRNVRPNTQGDRHFCTSVERILSIVIVNACCSCGCRGKVSRHLSLCTSRGLCTRSVRRAISSPHRRPFLILSSSLFPS